MLILMHKLWFPLRRPAGLFLPDFYKEKGSLAGSFFDIFNNVFCFVFVFVLSANEKWKKWIIFLYLFREKQII